MKYDVKIHNLRADGAIKAYASVNLNKEFAITGVKIMEGSKGTFVSMPSYKAGGGEYKDVCFPITKEARAEFIEAVLDGYEQALEQLQNTAHKKSDMPTEDQLQEQGTEPTATNAKGNKTAKAPKATEPVGPEMTM